ncbi:hypothetical protein HMPREF1990_01224 [Porphyromonas gingivalis W4087]|uniref:Secretion system C-terminal sorting domain-containing protein n=1 Tax=Porphyromonas gingivalis F0570 TaxID=1227271 RepID=A0A0E2LQP8_PORGN|nr:hypothetical protein HMPREF1555_01111 [Porphyromonas gingivalis F0570]ERJ88695.1 hypothetical protein HMPREF1990_01224 [Porphyromonas gingivalis W4087]
MFLGSFILLSRTDVKLSIDVSDLGRGNYVVDMQCKGHRKISRLITKE